MKSLFLRISLALVCLAPFAALCEEPPAVIQIGRESVKEGRTAAHRKVEADWARAFRRAKYPYHYIGLEAMTGAANEVWFISSYPSFAAVEESDKLIESGPLKNEVDLLDSRDGELRATSRSMLAVYRKDLSFHPERANLGKTHYMGLTTFRVKLGGMGGFMEGSKKFRDAYDKMKLPSAMLAYQVLGGAPAGTFLFFTPMESLKIMDSMGEMERALPQAMGPEDYARLMKGGGEVFNSIESSYFRVSPQMSYVSKETEEVDPAYWRPKAPAKPAADAKAKEKPGA